MYKSIKTLKLDVAKCNLCKVKIEPMQVAGLCVLGSADNPRSPCDMMRGGHKGLGPPLCWRGTLPVCEQILAFS